MIDTDKPLDNRLLYKYIQLAYEHINRIADDSVQGNRAAVLTRLYQRRIHSIFANVPLTGEQPDVDFHQFRDWFSSERAKIASDIIVGRIDELHIGRDVVQGFGERRQGLLKGFDVDVERGQIASLGLDAYASYLPIHFFFGGDEFSTNWGIYISEQGVMRLAAVLAQTISTEFGDPPPNSDRLFVEAAYQILLRHELEHFKVESFALNAEMFLQRAIYAPYLTKVYANACGSVRCLEESLANASVLDSVKIKKIFAELYPPKGVAWQQIVRANFFDLQPPEYRNYDLSLGWPQEKDPFRNRVAGYQDLYLDSRRNLKGRSLHYNARRLAMNYLCNQIVTGVLEPTSADVPFFAFLPDNYFLRAENLVPIHIVKSLSDDESFIHLATPSRMMWERFMRELGYRPTSRGKGDHEVWKNARAGWPPATLNYHKKDLDFNSFKSTLKDLNIKISDFHDYARSHKLPEPLLAKLERVAQP